MLVPALRVSALDWKEAHLRCLRAAALLDWPKARADEHPGAPLNSCATCRSARERAADQRAPRLADAAQPDCFYLRALREFCLSPPDLRAIGAVAHR